MVTSNPIIMDSKTLFNAMKILKNQKDIDKYEFIYSNILGHNS